MAVGHKHEPVTSFDQWYINYRVDEKGCLEFRSTAPCADHIERQYKKFQREADQQLVHYDKLELLVDAQVVTEREDLPNISSGDTAGLARRTARALVQNVPNIEILCEFDDDSLEGLFARQVCLDHIIGSDQYSNDMQQNLFASTKMAWALGFDTVVPTLCQQANGSWGMKYQSIHYRDVFPEPGIKDVRDAPTVFVRRYLTKGEVVQLIKDEAVGWDIAALKSLLKTDPSSRNTESVPHQTKKFHVHPEGYEVITWYTTSGDPFLTFDARYKMLLRIEKNKDPLRRHPVHFLVLERDLLQPYGKSQAELVLGRQEFQDLLLNGSMKLWYWGVNPTILGYGMNGMPNLGPGKYSAVSNPNAKVETFDASTSTLMQYGQISQLNSGAMIGLLGTPDQQTAAQGVYSQMSATPQGVEQQAAVVDVTTNNYQKAIEGFFSHYCSYALTVYFAELKATKSVKLHAEARAKMIRAASAAAKARGEDFDPQSIFNEDGTLKIDMSKMATEYYVRCVPGSLVEMEDEKQIRMLNELFIPLSQSFAGIAQTGDQQLIRNAALAMQFIVSKQIELSGSKYEAQIRGLWMEGDSDAVLAQEQRFAEVESTVAGATSMAMEELEVTHATIQQMQEQISLLAQGQSILLEKLGVPTQASAGEPAGTGQESLQGP